MILTLHHRTPRTGEAVSSHVEVFPQEDFPASNAASASANVSSWNASTNTFVLDAKTTADLLVTRLEAVYEVQAGQHSFAALIQGGQNNRTGRAVLDGVVLGGRRTGERIHVEYQVKTDCAGAPAGTCFQGTIHIERAFED